MLGKLAWGSIVIPAALVACSSCSSSGPAEVDAKDASAEGAVADAGAESNAPDATSDAPAGSAHVGDDCSKASDCAGLSSPLCLGAERRREQHQPNRRLHRVVRSGRDAVRRNERLLSRRHVPACMRGLDDEVTKPCAGKNVCVLSRKAQSPKFHPATVSADVEPTPIARAVIAVRWRRATARRRSGRSRIAGAPCTNAEDCPCVLPQDKTGYCSPFCVVGDDTCPAGYTCNIPYSLDSFGGNPKGAAGRCLKSCTTAADCPVAGETLVGWQCEEIAGHAKVCTPTP